MSRTLAEAVDDLRELIRRDVLVCLGPDPSGELARLPLDQLLMVYLNWRGRLIPSSPRQLLISAEMLVSPSYQAHQVAVDAIAAKIAAGADLTPHLSERVTITYEPTGSRNPKRQLRKDLDLLLADWGLHHLHLSTALEPSGFVQRTEDLLFANFQPSQAFLVGIFRHGEWTQEDLVAITVRNWPTAGIFHEARFVTGLAQPVAPNDRPALRNAGVTVPIEVDGKVYLPRGQSIAGTPIDVTRKTALIMWDLRRTTELVVDPGTGWEPFTSHRTFGVRHGTTGAEITVVELEGP